MIIIGTDFGSKDENVMVIFKLLSDNTIQILETHVLNNIKKDNKIEYSQGRTRSLR